MSTRIKLTDAVFDVVSKMSDGNPGAINTMMVLLKESYNIDPDDGMGGIGKILFMDTLGIYGTDIYVLWSDICERDITKMIAVLRATQMGMFKQEVLKDACSRQDYSGKNLVPVEELCKKVKEKLPNFKIG